MALATPTRSVPARVWGQAGIIVLGTFMTMLSATVVDPALPTLATVMDASPGSVAWVACGYLMGLAAAVPLSAWAARRFGTRRLWLTCLVLFALGSALCAVSWSIGALIVARALQGAVGGVLVPTGQALLGAVAGREQMGRVLSTIGLPVVVAPTLGTSVGGVLADHLGLSWLFWINIPLAVLALALGARSLPRIDAGAAGRLDWVGLVLVVGGLVSLIYGLAGIGGAGGPGSVTADVYALAGVVLLGALVLWSRRRQSPILRLNLLSNPLFSAAAITLFFGGLVNFGAQVVLPLYFTQVRGEGTPAAGLLVGSQVLGTALGFPIAGRLADRYGGGALLLAGGALTALATVPLALAGLHTAYWWLCLVLFVRGLGVALGTIPAMTVCLSAVQRDQLPDAAPISNIIQRTGATVGTAIVAVIYAHSLLHEPPSAAAALGAFQHVSWWLVAGALALAVPAYILARAEHQARSKHRCSPTR